MPESLHDQSVPVMVLRNWSMMSALACRVLIVVGWRSEEQVVRAATPWIVATMANEHAFGDRPVGVNPRSAMGEWRAGRPVDRHSIAGFVDGPCPIPAFTGLVDSIPEALLGVFGVPNVAAGNRAIRVGVAALCWKLHTARLAFSNRLQGHFSDLLDRSGRCHWPGLLAQSPASLRLQFYHLEALNA